MNPEPGPPRTKAPLTPDLSTLHQIYGILYPRTIRYRNPATPSKWPDGICWGNRGAWERFRSKDPNLNGRGLAVLPMDVGLATYIFLWLPDGWNTDRRA